MSELKFRGDPSGNVPLILGFPLQVLVRLLHYMEL